MARRIEHRTRWASDPKTAYTALVDPEYLRERLAVLGGRGATLADHRADGDGVSYRLRHGVASEDLPPAVRTLLGGDLTIDRVETWRPDGDGYSGTVRVALPGMPGELAGTMRLTAVGDGTEHVIDGSLRVPIPLVGGMIEESVAGRLTTLLDKEAAFTGDWLARH